MLDAIQRNRRANLRIVLKELAFDGICRRPGKAVALHTNRHALAGMMAGRHIPEDFAREVEWLLHKHAGWMDEDERHRDL
jgi:hypothetical protein